MLWPNIQRPILCVRFIDDIFLVHNSSNIDTLDKSFGTLKLNITTGKVVNFLDLNISINSLNNSLSFSLYIKPTNTFSYLLSTSNHPKFIFTNIPKSLFIRVRRICSSLSDFQFFSRTLTTQLVSRGYTFPYLRKIINMVMNLDRSKIIEFIDNKLNNSFLEGVFFQLQFNFNVPNIKEILNSSGQKTVPIIDKFKFNVVHNMSPNISSL